MSWRRPVPAPGAADRTLARGAPQLSTARGRWLAGAQLKEKTIELRGSRATRSPQDSSTAP